jgi:hypothetical protein
MRTQISKPEHALLTLGVAQKMAGKNEIPTARTLRQANTDVKGSIVKAGVSVRGGTGAVDRLVNRICGELSGMSGMSGDETGNFWSSAKNAITSAASKVIPFAPFMGPTATLAVPAAKALMKSSSSPAPTAAADVHDEENVAMVGYERGKVENYDYIFGFGDLDERVFGDRGRSDTGAWDHDSLVFGADVEDTLIFGEGGGSSERNAANRRQGRSRTGNSPLLRALTRMKGNGGAQMSPEVYRAAIIQRGKKLAVTRGRKSPNTKDMFDAQISVDTDLSKTGARVVVPGAQPGRVTR